MVKLKLILIFFSLLAVATSMSIIRAPSGWDDCGRTNMASCAEYCKANNQNLCYCWERPGELEIEEDEAEISLYIPEDEPEDAKVGIEWESKQQIQQNSRKMKQIFLQQEQPIVIETENYRCQCSPGIC